MGKRGRRREGSRAGGDAGTGSDAGLAAAPTSTYADADGGELELRGSLSLQSRARYAQTLSGGNHQDDAWQRATELLFEQLAVSWTIAGLRIDRQRELLGRYRMASKAERQFVRESLRAHLAENFPEMEAP